MGEAGATVGWVEFRAAERNPPLQMGSAKEAFGEFLTHHAQVVGNLAEYGGHCSQAQGRVQRYGYMVFPAGLRCEALVTSRGSSCLVIKCCQKPGQLKSGDVPRQSQTAITSSRTK